MQNSQAKPQLKPILLHCINELFEEAVRNDQAEIKIRASELQEKTKIFNRFPSICNAMKSIIESDRDKHTSGVYKSSTYTIKYKLPRIKPIEIEDIPDIKKSYSSNRTTKKKKITINKPTVSEINIYLGKWEKMEKYVLQENALNKLFIKTYPNNVDIDDILIKVCSLNVFYSTSIFEPLKVARHIKDLNIDVKLEQNDISLVNEIAQVKVDKEKTIDFYSFATKYCSHHKPDIYPIYDYYVERTLKHFNREYRFYDFKNNDFKDYHIFNKIILSFQDKFDLKRFSL